MTVKMPVPYLIAGAFISVLFDLTISLFIWWGWNHMVTDDDANLSLPRVAYWLVLILVVVLDYAWTHIRSKRRQAEIEAVYNHKKSLY